MLYSDGIHLVSDVSVDDLHRYCQQIGIKRCWYHRSRFPHYDIPKKKRATFFVDHPEVRQVSGREIVELLKASGLVKNI